MNNSILDLVMMIKNNPMLNELDDRLDEAFGLQDGKEPNIIKICECADKFKEYNLNVSMKQIAELASLAYETGVDRFEKIIDEICMKEARARIEKIQNDMKAFNDETELRIAEYRKNRTNEFTKIFSDKIDEIRKYEKYI